MSHYELALAISANIEESVRTEVVEKAKGYIERYGGEITGVESWSKRRLAYEIQHQREAYYYFLHFNAEPTCPGELEKEARIMDNVLRYLIVKEEEEFVPKAEQVKEEAPVEEVAEETIVEEPVADETVAEETVDAE